MQTARTAAIVAVLALAVLDGTSGLGLFERGGSEGKPPTTVPPTKAVARAEDPATKGLVEEYHFREPELSRRGDER